jgi:hypothetical protein
MIDRPSLASLKKSRVAASAALFLIGLLAWLLLLLGNGDAPRAWRALLINFIYAAPLAAGLVTWSAIVVAANGRWAGDAERLAWRGIGFAIPSLLLLLGLWFGSPDWAPWYGKELHQGIWLDNTVLFIRELAGLVLFWGTAAWYLMRRAQGRRGAVMPAAILVIVYCVVFTVFAFDFVMALLPAWRSGIFGAYFFISSLYLAMVFWTVLAVLQQGSPVELRHDLGKLVLAFSILTTSLLYMQLLTIWYENLPEETSYLIQRMNVPDWQVVSTFLVLVVYLGPLAMLLTEWSKKNRLYLGAVSALLLIGLWIERWWMVAPTFSAETHLGLVELAAATAVLGLFGLSITLSQNYLPKMPVDEVEVPLKQAKGRE